MIIFMSACPIYSYAASLTFEQLESKTHLIKNPFQSQLPEKEKTPDIPKPEVRLNDPRGPVEDPRFSQQPKVAPIVPKIIEMPMPKLTINGIIWNSDRPQAIINDQIIDIGDTISEVTITGIQKGGIDVLFHGEKSTLTP